LAAAPARSQVTWPAPDQPRLACPKRPVRYRATVRRWPWPTFPWNALP